jgi:hypothetical protein
MCYVLWVVRQKSDQKTLVFLFVRGWLLKMRYLLANGIIFDQAFDSFVHHKYVDFGRFISEL